MKHNPQPTHCIPSTDACVLRVRTPLQGDCFGPPTRITNAGPRNDEVAGLDREHPPQADVDTQQ